MPSWVGSEAYVWMARRDTASAPASEGHPDGQPRPQLATFKARPGGLLAPRAPPGLSVLSADERSTSGRRVPGVGDDPGGGFSRPPRHVDER